MSTENKTVEVDFDLMNNLLCGLLHYHNQYIEFNAQNYINQIDDLFNRQATKPIDALTERTYTIDFIVEFCQKYTSLCDKEDEDIIKQIKAFLPRYDKYQYLK
jgi:hypothetical protein